MKGKPVIKSRIIRRMIETNTTFILGAGASCSYGFPSAYELYDKICRGECQTPPLPRGDPLMHEIADGMFGEFQKELRHSGHQSVDAFLEHRPDLIDIGKRAIACGLIPFESEDALFATEGGPRWYQHLFAAMNSSLPRFRENAVQFLTFNYDRSLEHFLATSLAQTHNVPLAKAAEELRHVSIIHLYGALGPYDPVRGFGRAYEPIISPQAVQQCVDSLKIVPEDRTDDKEFSRGRDILAETRRVIFLGFHFHKANVERLRLGVVPNGVDFYASAYGMKDLEKKRAERLVKRGMVMGPPTEDALDFLRARVELAED